MFLPEFIAFFCVQCPHTIPMVTIKPPNIFCFKTHSRPFKQRTRLERYLIPLLKNQRIACMTATECVIIMADKHTSESNYLSLKEMVKSYAQSKWLYINRAFGGHRHYCTADGGIDACFTQCERTGKESSLFISSKEFDSISP